MVRPIAFYLPQFHPIPENDAWWGKGFTEWTNTAKAKPLFPGHYQPHVPADLGFYDLRVPETRAAQAAMARQYGIEAFCYYHYWFGNGRRLLERPFNEVLESGEPDFPFCLCWANQTWTGRWHGAPDRVLIQQVYPGEDDHRAHFEWLLKAFRDPRYLRVDGCPLFLVFDVGDLPDPTAVFALWRGLARDAGLPGLYLLGVRHNISTWDPHPSGFDGAVDMRLPIIHEKYLQKLQDVTVVDHRRIARFELIRQTGVTHYPCVGPSWDNTPRLGRRGLVYRNSSPDQFRSTVARAVKLLEAKPPQQRLLFLKAWNEWAEGNHLEPDLRDGHAWLEALRAGLGGGPPHETT